MAMIYRVSATLDAKSEAALYRIMERTGWTKSQAVREAIWAAAERRGLVGRPVSGQLNARKSKVTS
jgi:hypothetical protein